MLVTLLGMLIEERAEQSEKAYLPMLVTLSGMVTEVRRYNPKQIKLGMIFTFSPNVIDVIGQFPNVGPSFESSHIIAFHTTVVREVQLLKPPMLFTFSGMVMEVREEQFSKALLPMLVTLSPIVTEVKEEQLLKAHSPMLVTLLGMVTEVRA